VEDTKELDVMLGTDFHHKWFEKKLVSEAGN
jgi:hypothetical protein